MADDYEGTSATTGVVDVGGSVTGNIETKGDQDWFAVVLEAGKTYRIDMEGESTGQGSLSHTHLRGIRGPRGSLLPDTDDTHSGQGYNSRVYITATEDGTYHVMVRGWKKYTGTYKLSVTEVEDASREWGTVRDSVMGDSDGMDDFTSGTDTTGTVAVGGTAAGKVDFENDRDWFKVDLVPGKTYRIDLEGRDDTGNDALDDPYLHGIYDSDGDLIAGTTDDNDGYGPDSRVFFTAAVTVNETDTYYVAAGADGDGEGKYRLSVTEVTSASTSDLPATTATSGSVSVDGSVLGLASNVDDIDWFKVVLEAGETYRIDLEGRQTDAGTLSDPYLYGIYDSDSNLIADTTDNDGGDRRNSRVTFTAPADGTYYVAAGATGRRGGSYTLTVTDVDDYVAGVAGTGIEARSGEVAVGGSVRGEIGFSGDQDWFKVALKAGGTYRIDLEGSRGGFGTLSDPYLRGIHDAKGNLLYGTTNDDGGSGRNSRLTFTASKAGDYYISAGADRNKEGTYKLSVTEVVSTVTDDFADAIWTTGTVTVGGSATGEIQFSGDQDWFKVDLEADKTYQILLEGAPTDNGTLPDPVLVGLYTAYGSGIRGTLVNDTYPGPSFTVDLLDGTLTYDDDDALNSLLVYTPRRSGTYFVSAGGNRDLKGTYKLSVTEGTAGLTDDYLDTIATTGVVTLDDDGSGSVTGEVQYTGDRDWFKVELVPETTYEINLRVNSDYQTYKYGERPDPYLYGVHDSTGVPSREHDERRPPRRRE